MSSEKSLWRWLSKARMKLGDHLHMIRVENHIIPGVPDVELCYKSKQFWIELKSIKRPIREKTLINVKFRPAQIPWLIMREKAGGGAGVLLSITNSNNTIDRYYITPSNLHYLQRIIPSSALPGISHLVPKFSNIFIEDLCVGKFIR